MVIVSDVQFCRTWSNGRVTTRSNPKSITEIFNEFFSCIINDLSKNVVSPDLVKLQEYTNAKIPLNTSFNIPPINQQFVLGQLQNLDFTKGSGSDGIGPKLLKFSSIFISKSVSRNN